MSKKQKPKPETMDYSLIFTVAMLLVVVLSAVGVFRMFETMVKIVAVVIVMFLCLHLYNSNRMNYPVPEEIVQNDTLPEKPSTEPYSPSREALEGLDSMTADQEKIIVDENGTTHHHHYYYFYNEKEEKKEQETDPFIYADAKSEDQKEIRVLEEEEVEKPSVNCYRYERSVKHYIILEHVYESQLDAEEQVVFLQSEGFRQAQVICLDCFAGYKGEKHFAVILDRPCQTEETLYRKRQACLKRWKEKGWPNREMKLLRLGTLKKQVYINPDEKDLAQKAARPNRKIY